MLIEDYVVDSDTGKLLHDYSKGIDYRTEQTRNLFRSSQRLAVFDYFGHVGGDRIILVELEKRGSKNFDVTGCSLELHLDNMHLIAKKFTCADEETFESNPLVFLAYAKALGINDNVLEKLNEYIDTYINKNKYEDVSKC